MGYDFTFTVPKSVSLLYALTGDQEILERFARPWTKPCATSKSEMKTRVRRSGKRHQPHHRQHGLGGVHPHHVAAGGRRSRPATACPLLRLQRDLGQQECRWKAGQFRELKRDAPYFQAAFRVRLANKLQDLGFGIERKRDDFEIAGIPASAIKRFSRRTEEIEKWRPSVASPTRNAKAELGRGRRGRKRITS